MILDYQEYVTEKAQRGIVNYKAMEDRRKVEAFDLVDCKEFLKRVNLTRDKLPTAWETLLKL